MTTGRLDWIHDELERLERKHLRRELVVRQGPQRAQIRMDAEPFVNFSSNDYLGLANDFRIAAAACQAANELGWGSGASPLVTGRSPLHAQLETELARFEGVEAARTFSTGFGANAGTIAALVGREDAIFSDAKNHASIIDGCRLSGAKVVVYPHRDSAACKQLLNGAGNFRRRLIVTDSLFSMDGDVARLTDLVELADAFDAMLMVDEAHATGVMGECGRGVCEAQGIEAHVDVRVGTLSKALGSIGGFVAGSRVLIDWLTHRARPYVFSTAPPSAFAAAGLAALQIVRDEPERRRVVLQRAAHVRDTVSDCGWNVGDSTSQIIPLIIGDAAQTMKLAGRLREFGMLVPGIRPPSVPPGEALLRVCLSYAHSDDDVDRLTGVLVELRGQV